MIKLLRRYQPLWVILAMCLTGNATANPGWMEGISVLFEKPESAAFQIHLANRFQMAAAETEAGNRCSVRLQPRFDLQRYRERYATETQFWEPSESIPLEKMTGEWIANQFWIELHFSRSVACSFQVSSNQQDLWVSLQPVDAKQIQGIQKILAKARAALASGDTDSAIDLYSKLLRVRDNPLREQTLEYLGVAHERARHFAKAKKIYQKWLETYTESTGYDRVTQRLQGVELILAPDKLTTDTLRKPDTTSDRKPWRWFGVISNSYQSYNSDNGESGFETLDSSWTTDLNLNGRYRDSELDAKVLLNGSYRHSFEGDNDNPERLSSAYGDVYLKPSEQQIRLGRQTTNGEGVLYRYDGIHYSKGLSSQFNINALWGYPVLSTRDISPNSDAQLYGFSLDFEPVDSHWKSNVFFSEQTQDGRLDRRAVGGEISYFTPKRNWLAYLDYDIQFNELNTLMLNGNWFGAEESHYYLSLDYRRSPVLTLSNALIGQTLSTLDQLANQGLNDSDLEEVALDRTAISHSVAVGASRRFHPHYRWAADLSFWELSGTEDSLGVTGFDGSDLETNLSLQLIANDLWIDNDLSWLTLRYADLTTSQLTSLTAETRYPINKQWRIRPRLQTWVRNYTALDGSETAWKPQVRVDYQPSKNWLFEGEVGYEWNTVEQNGLSVDRNDYFLYLRADWIF